MILILQIWTLDTNFFMTGEKYIILCMIIIQSKNYYVRDYVGIRDTVRYAQPKENTGSWWRHLRADGMYDVEKN